MDLPLYTQAIAIAAALFYITGIVFALFIIVIAAAEVALALGIVVRTFRSRART